MLAEKAFGVDEQSADFEEVSIVKSSEEVSLLPRPELLRMQKKGSKRQGIQFKQFK